MLLESRRPSEGPSAAPANVGHIASFEVEMEAQVAALGELLAAVEQRTAVAVGVAPALLDVELLDHSFGIVG